MHSQQTRGPHNAWCRADTPKRLQEALLPLADDVGQTPSKAPGLRVVPSKGTVQMTEASRSQAAVPANVIL